MEETKSEYLKALREAKKMKEDLSEVSEEYLERCKAFANFIIENDCKQQGDDEEEE